MKRLFPLLPLDRTLKPTTTTPCDLFWLRRRSKTKTKIKQTYLPAPLLVVHRFHMISSLWFHFLETIPYREK
jgi:hypothetical protein